MKTSKFLKVDNDILIEYIYNSNNLLSENYKVLVNTQLQDYSYISPDLSSTNNIMSNQLFEVDAITNKWAIADPTNNNFLQAKDYPSGMPVRFDTINIYFPVNYTFANNLGMHLKVYAYDYSNYKSYTLSNFFYDQTNVNTSTLVQYATPPIIFLEKLWGKYITISVPSVFDVASQRTGNNATIDTINSNLTNGYGLSNTSPIFVDFQFISKISAINNINYYYLDNARTISFPQSPEFENLAVVIEESPEGDYFDIYGTYNGTIGDFGTFIDNSFNTGNRYHVEYWITMFEENIKGKTQRFILTDNFTQKTEFRPIIKFSTTTAVIDVEMKLIDENTGSQVSRMASYGMLEQQLSKYSLNLTKINITNASKPKIYNLKSNAATNSSVNLAQSARVVFQKVNVPYPVLIDRFNVVAKSDSVVNGGSTYYGLGKLQMTIYPFDNIISFVIAQQVDQASRQLLDLNTSSTVKLVFKNVNYNVECQLFTDTNLVDLANGYVVFKIFISQISNIRKIYESGTNVFYIIGSDVAGTTSTVIYSGTFQMFDGTSNVNNLNNQGTTAPSSNANANIVPNTSSNNGTAIITVQQTNTTLPTSPAPGILQVSPVSPLTTVSVTAPTSPVLDVSVVNQQILTFNPNSIQQ